MAKKNPQKNLIFATFIAVSFFVIWEMFVMKPLKKKDSITKKQENSIKIDEDKLQEIPEFEEKNIVVKGKTIILENDFIKAEIDTLGLKITSTFLKKYTENLKTDNNVELLSTKDNFYIVNLGWLGEKTINIPDKYTIWDVKKINSTSAEFTFKNKDNFLFKTIISLDDKYLFNVKQNVENNVNNLELFSYIEIQKNYLEKKRDINSSFEKILFTNNKKIEEIKLKKLNKKSFEYNENVNWVAFTDKYWLTSIINTNKDNIKANFLKKDNLVKIQFINKTAKNTNEADIFIGAKDLKILDDYSKENNIKLFDRSVDFGLLYFITKPMYLLLILFNKILGNFGLAIILLTIIVKFALYPSVKKSTLSMLKMKKIQPRMKELQEKYKGDTMTLNMKLMELYKKEEVKPLAGITPIFIQIPVFLALYKVFSVSLDMRHAPFFGYIKDLSSADPTSIFNLFGLLPFNIINMQIGFLPCLMAFTMWAQNKLMAKNNSAGGGKGDDFATSMSNSMKFLPFIFLFMFSSFPTGLLIYWILSNIISIGQQYYIEKKYVKN